MCRKQVKFTMSRHIDTKTASADCTNERRTELLSVALVLLAKAFDKEQYAVVNASKKPALKDPDGSLCCRESWSTHDSPPTGIVTPSSLETLLVGP